jgi:hypothetical protein
VTPPVARIVKNTQEQLLVWSEAKSLNNLSQKQKRAASGLKQNLLTISLAIGVELRICIERMQLLKRRFLTEEEGSCGAGCARKPHTPIANLCTSFVMCAAVSD